MNDSQAYTHDFEVFYRAHFESVVLFFRRRLPKTCDSEDLAQEVFVRLWNRHPDTPLSRGYLFRTAQNLLTDTYRAQGRRRTLFIEADVDRGADQKTDLKLVVYDAINRLPEKLRTIFLLSKYEGFKYVEIAEICEISVQTVEKRMRSALKRLEQALR